MTLKDHSNNKDHFEKLINIVLIPVHNDLNIVPPYPLGGKREIICGPNLQTIDTIERKFIRTRGRFLI